jgi:hypothetical protein
VRIVTVVFCNKDEFITQSVIHFLGNEAFFVEFAPAGAVVARRKIPAGSLGIQKHVNSSRRKSFDY